MIELTPQSGEAEGQRHAIDSELMAELDAGGRLAGEMLVSSLLENGYNLVLVRPRFRRVELPPPRVLELWFNPPKDPSVAALSYREGMPRETPSQKRAAKRQEAFYARYEKAIPIDDTAAATLSAEDRLLFVI